LYLKNSPYFLRIRTKSTTTSTMSTPLLTGTIPALVTPFKESGELDVSGVPAMIEFLLEGGASAFYINGSTGEGFGMTIAERKEMCVATVNAVAKRVPVVVHVGATGSTETACELAKHAEEVGADATSAVPFIKPDVYTGGEGNSFEEAMIHFRAIGGASNLPFYVYWIMASSDFTATEFIDAVKDVPHMAGMKFTSTNFYLFQQILDKSDFNMVTGPDEMNIAGKAMGAHGAIGSTYNVHMKNYVKMDNAFKNGDNKTAMKLQTEANRVIAVLIDKCNCKKRGTNIVAGIKAWLRSKGVPAGYPRAVSSDPMDEAAIKELMDALNGLNQTIE